MEMAYRIKERRTAMGLTQEELAEKCGLQKSAIAKYENGRVVNMKKSVIAKMSEVLECNPAYLMGYCSNPSPSAYNLNIREEERHIIELYNRLNDAGKKKARDYMKDLTGNKEYTESKAEEGGKRFA